TGPGSVTFSLNSINYQMDSTFTDLPAGNYVVTVKNNEGCIIQQAVKLEDTCGKTVFIPSAFTPNADGINDDWAIYFTSPTVEIEEMTIFNRWGEVIFYSRPGNVTSGATIWDGKYKGQQAHGVFVYQLLIKMSAQQASYVYRGQVSTL
ncbi:MAG TPA: gliding motility-associated C-terminal domain-containing protein, partial [Dyadobacter sp.]|nr:gliding motility-associated C-terminal domain-containing protein [Dyadobacter sp.]